MLVFKFSDIHINISIIIINKHNFSFDDCTSTEKKIPNLL